MYKYKWKLNIWGRGVRPDKCIAVALSFLRTYVDWPEILTLAGIGREGSHWHRRDLGLGWVSF